MGFATINTPVREKEKNKDKVTLTIVMELESPVHLLISWHEIEDVLMSYSNITSAKANLGGRGTIDLLDE